MHICIPLMKLCVMLICLFLPTPPAAMSSPAPPTNGLPAGPVNGLLPITSKYGNLPPFNQGAIPAPPPPAWQGKL